MDTRSLIESEFQERLDAIVKRSEEVEALPSFLPASHFAPPASETRMMYRMGYFYGAIMVAQATAEALARFIAKSKGMDERYYCERDERNGGVTQAKRLEDLKQEQKISPRAFRQFRMILDNERNSFHHMNSDVPTTPSRLKEMALECVEALYSIEGAFLDVGSGGRLHVQDYELWDVRKDGSVSVYMDCTRI